MHDSVVQMWAKWGNAADSPDMSGNRQMICGTAIAVPYSDDSVG